MNDMDVRIMEQERRAARAERELESARERTDEALRRMLHGRDSGRAVELAAAVGHAARAEREAWSRARAFDGFFGG